MALQNTDYGTLAAVLVVVLAVLVYTNIKARGASAGGIRRGGEEEPTVSPLLSRFAHHDGDVVGETVAVQDDRLILKQAGVFKAVPLAQAELDGQEVRIRGEVDWEAAKVEGQAWLEANRRGHDAEVTPELTRSEDVRAPALEAFQRREAELVSDDSEE